MPTRLSYFLPDNVVVEFVVTRERDQAAPAGGKGEENLSRRVFPNRHVLQSLPLGCQKVLDAVQ